MGAARRNKTNKGRAIREQSARNAKRLSRIINC
jgi:hypothetical protein